jgi:hypothetical protein
VCALQVGGLACEGAVPTPRGYGFQAAHLSPGEDASACATDISHGVQCWGEAYSAPGTLDVPVHVVFEVPPASGNEVAVVDTPAPQGWFETCRVHGKCGTAAPPLPRCPPCMQTRSWSEIAASGESLVGQVVSVRGPLTVSTTRMSTLLGCEYIGTPPSNPPGLCCNHVGGAIVLGAGPDAIPVGGMGCGGDESRLCCNAPAYGQSVVVTGRLGKADDGFRRWKLYMAQACADE